MASFPINSLLKLYFDNICFAATCRTTIGKNAKRNEILPYSTFKDSAEKQVTITLSLHFSHFLLLFAGINCPPGVYSARFTSKSVCLDESQRSRDTV